MALARCEVCGRPQGRGGNVYVSCHLPIGYPETGVICGSSECERPGKVWLIQEEQAQYQKGTRVFRLPTQAAKVKLTEAD